MKAACLAFATLLGKDPDTYTEAETDFFNSHFYECELCEELVETRARKWVRRLKEELPRITRTFRTVHVLN